VRRLCIVSGPLLIILQYVVVSASKPPLLWKEIENRVPSYVGNNTAPMPSKNDLTTLFHETVIAEEAAACKMKEEKFMKYI